MSVVADPGRILFGSDWPFAPESLTAESVKNLAELELREQQSAAIDRGNALALFPRVASLAGA